MKMIQWIGKKTQLLWETTTRWRAAVNVLFPSWVGQNLPNLILLSDLDSSIYWMWNWLKPSISTIEKWGTRIPKHSYTCTFCLLGFSCEHARDPERHSYSISPHPRRSRSCEGNGSLTEAHQGEPFLANTDNEAGMMSLLKTPTPFFQMPPQTWTRHS